MLNTYPIPRWTYFTEPAPRNRRVQLHCLRQTTNGTRTCTMDPGLLPTLAGTLLQGPALGIKRLISASIEGIGRYLCPSNSAPLLYQSIGNKLEYNILVPLPRFEVYLKDMGSLRLWLVDAKGKIYGFVLVNIVKHLTRDLQLDISNLSGYHGWFI
jgi:hypothetical protein